MADGLSYFLGHSQIDIEERMLRILLTNDDGIDAPGLAALYAAVTQSLGDVVDVTVVAPIVGAANAVTASRRGDRSTSTSTDLAGSPSTARQWIVFASLCTKSVPTSTR